MIRSFIFLSIILLLAHQAMQAKKVKALFLGNSYTQTNNLPEIIAQLALSNGDTLEYSSHTPGGFTFSGHAASATSVALIEEGDWDFVILQEQSQLPSFPDEQVEAEVYPYARMLDSMIQVNNPCATTLFYVTWGRENGDAANCPYFDPLCTYEGMDSMLQLRYTIMAEEHQAALSPVAMVWRKIRNEHPDIDLYTADGSHPGSSGSFAAACSFYTLMFRKDPATCSYNYSLSAADAGIIKTAAKQVAYDSLDHWNRFVVWPQAEFTAGIVDGFIDAENLSTHASHYYWDFGDGHTSEEENPSHTYTASGTYTVRLIAAECLMSDTFYMEVSILVSGIEPTFKADNVRIYPNPAQSDVHIRADEKIEHIRIMDMSGKIIYQEDQWGKTTATIDMSAFPPGTYGIVLTIQGNSSTIKFTKY